MDESCLKDLRLLVFEIDFRSLEIERRVKDLLEEAAEAFRRGKEDVAMLMVAQAQEARRDAEALRLRAIFLNTEIKDYSPDKL
jgi:hypothetical protein